MKKKLIVIKHAILDAIEDGEAIQALPEELQRMEHIFITVAPVRVTLEEIHTIHWPSASREQRRQFRQEIQPVLAENEGSPIAYFGLAPIPLAVQLGYLIEPVKKVYVFQRHHQSKSWQWEKAGEDAQFRVKTNGVPKDKFELPGDVILRVKSSFDIRPEITVDMVRQHTKEIDIETETLNKDIFQSSVQLEKFAGEYSSCLDAISSYLPETDTIHLFAAVTVGVAFLLGAKVNPNVHPRISVYNYSKLDGGQYEQAVILQSDAAEITTLTQSEHQEADRLRKELSFEYEQIKGFVTTIKSQRPVQPSWEAPLFVGSIPQVLSEGRWKYMPRIEDTPILISTIDLKEKNTGELFYDESAKRWMLDDNFLHSLRTRLVEPEKIKRAFRLFIFHESCHFDLGLSSYQASGIGRFPRVLEEADFYADVWAMIHEYRYTIYSSGEKQTKPATTFFADLIDLALETIWAFDANTDMTRPQVRRVNRYLIWYYLHAQLRLSVSEQLDDAIQMLAVKPIIDLRGPLVKVDPDGRVEYVFTAKPNSTLSLAIYDHENIIQRATTDTHMPLADLLHAFIHRNSGRVKEVIYAFCDAVHPKRR